MVEIKKTLIIMLLSLFTLSFQAQGRVVDYVEIKWVGLHPDGDKDENEKRACKGFRPTEKQIIEFFNKAKESKKTNGLVHDYYSPCSSTGLVKFKDGASGSWAVESSGLAFVTFDNGESAVFFRKDNAWFDPFACSYSPSGEDDC